MTDTLAAPKMPTDDQLVSYGLRLINIGLRLAQGDTGAIEDARHLVEDMGVAAIPVEELAPSLTPTGHDIAEAVADAAERLKFAK